MVFTSHYLHNIVFEVNTMPCLLTVVLFVTGYPTKLYFQNSCSSASKKRNHKLVPGVQQLHLCPNYEKLQLYHVTIRWSLNIMYGNKYPCCREKLHISNLFDPHLGANPEMAWVLWGTLFGRYSNVIKVSWCFMSAVPRHFIQQPVKAKKQKKKLPRLQVVTPQRGTILRKAFPCHDVLMRKQRKIHSSCMI